MGEPIASCCVRHARELVHHLGFCALIFAVVVVAVAFFCVIMEAGYVVHVETEKKPMTYVSLSI